MITSQQQVVLRAYELPALPTRRAATRVHAGTFVARSDKLNTIRLVFIYSLVSRMFHVHWT